MYSIETKQWGFKLTFGGIIDTEEMAKWVAESELALANAPEKFGVFVDMRTLHPLERDVQEVMQKGQILYKTKGMERSCVILSSTLLSMQFQRIAKSTGIYEWERYISASSHPDFEKIGEKWIIESIDPDR